eukprot:gene21696-24603_t
MKLLLAEDDAMLADALQTQLGGAGFEVEHAPNGAVADYLLQNQPASTPALLGRLTLDHTSRRALVGGEPLDLSGREWSLLELLVQQRDKVVTKEQITQTWIADGGELGAGNSIEVYIHRLRRKLEDAGLVIRTVRGLGYLMEATGP